MTDANLIDIALADQHRVSVHAAMRGPRLVKRSPCPLQGCSGHRTHDKTWGGGLIACPNIPVEHAILVQAEAIDPDAAVLCPLLRQVAKEAREHLRAE